MAGAIGFAACAGDAGAPVPAGPTVAIQTSPISYPGIANVCFALEVFNGQPGPGTDTVWSKEHLCSEDFGNGEGGAISYVGTCDASVEGDNYVALTLESITVEGGQTLDDQTGGGLGFDGADFQNPCTADDRCYLHFACEENQDVRVEFNLTVMRDAEQGFFDIGVAFDDIFCAAKVDTCTAPDTAIELLYGDDVNDGAGTDRTAVAAVACTAGPDSFDHTFDTHLLFTSKVVSCNDGAVTFTLDAVGEDEGQLTATADGGDETLHYANYFGAELLACGGYLTMNQDGDLLFECGGPEYCRIAGAGVDNEWGGYGFSSDDNEDAGFAPAAQGSQRVAASYKGSLGYGSSWVYVSDAATRSASQRSGSTLTYYDGNGNEVTPALVDGKVPGWEPVITTASCNKTYYNTAIDVENLAGQGLYGCTLSFQATAIASDSTLDFDASSGTFDQPGGMYGAVNVAAVPLTGAFDGDQVAAVCDANPLDGTNLGDGESLVQTHYIGELVGENPAFCFHSDDGGVLQQLAGCGAVEPPSCVPPQVLDENGVCVTPSGCPINCTECQPWAATLVCAEDGADFVCTIDNAPANTEVFVGPTVADGGVVSGVTDDNGHVAIVLDDGPGSYWAYVIVNDGENYSYDWIATTVQECTACVPGTYLNQLGRCVGGGGA